MKTYKNLWDDFISDANIDKAIKDFAKGKKKRRKDVRTFLAKYNNNPKGAIDYIRNYVIDYVNDTHTPVVIYDGKKAIEKWIRHDIKNCKYCLKLDVKKYFDSIPHDILKSKLEKELKDERLLTVLFTIIDSTEKGLPLGFYTSQWLSMWYLKDFDHYIKEHCYAPHYMRYMDDMVIFGANKKKLWQTHDTIIIELKKLGLELNQRSVLFRFVYEKNGKELGRDLDFMGFRFFRNRTILRRTIYYKMCRKARKIYKKEKPSIYELRQMMSYLGYLNGTNVYSAYIEYIKPFFDFGKAKKRISNYDRRVTNGDF